MTLSRALAMPSNTLFDLLMPSQAEDKLDSDPTCIKMARYACPYSVLSTLQMIASAGIQSSHLSPRFYCQSRLSCWSRSRCTTNLVSRMVKQDTTQTPLSETDKLSPFFAPNAGVEQMQGTKAGRDASTRYNNHLRLETLRHAIVGNLRHPVLGFEEVGRRHFSMCRQRIVVQAQRWMLEAKGTPLYKSFEKVYAEVLLLLSAEDLQTYDSLPPLADDLKALRRLTRSRLDDDDRKPSARPPRLEPPVNSNDVHPVPSVSEGQISVANPWAAATSAFASFVPGSQGTNDDSDDE